MYRLGYFSVRSVYLYFVLCCKLLSVHLCYVVNNNIRYHNGVHLHYGRYTNTATDRPPPSPFPPTCFACHDALITAAFCQHASKLQDGIRYGFVLSLCSRTYQVLVFTLSVVWCIAVIVFSFLHASYRAHPNIGRLGWIITPVFR